MKPTAVFKGMIADTRQQGQIIDYKLAERNTRAVICEQSVEEEQASGLVDNFMTNAEDPLFVGWPIVEEDCPYARLGTKCDPFCVYCDMKHVCMHCALYPSSAESSVDPPCPLRIPGCRCSTGAGPSIREYYCNAGDRFMGAYVQGAGEEEYLEAEIEDEECFEEKTKERDVIEEENQDSEFVEESGNERLFKEIGGGGPLEENKGEEFAEDETQRLYSPQSLWPLSPRFWKGLVPGQEQGLLPPFQVGYNDYSDFLSEPPTIDSQTSVATGRHGRGGRAQSSMDVPQLPIAYDNFAAASQCTPGGKISSSGEPATEESESRASHAQKPTRKDAAVGATTKKDSRGWEDREKKLVKKLMQEVILEGTHARTEERWKVICRRLSSRYSVHRTWTAVKNHWNRQGRSDSNIDERKVKKPDRMITGVQDPESRRKARNMKRKEAESDNGNDLVDLDDEDSDSARSAKRQRHQKKDPDFGDYFR